MVRKLEQNEYGAVVKYDSGDRVRVWPIKGNPTGTVVRVVDYEVWPLKYLVRYKYPETGTEFTEDFEQSDLTLVERAFTYYCNCGTEGFGDNHPRWCNRRR